MPWNKDQSWGSSKFCLQRPGSISPNLLFCFNSSSRKCNNYIQFHSRNNNIFNSNDIGLWWFLSILQAAFADRYWAIYLFCDLSHIGFQDKRETFVISTSSIGSTKACKVNSRKRSFLKMFVSRYSTTRYLFKTYKGVLFFNPFNGLMDSFFSNEK